MPGSTTRHISRIQHMRRLPGSAARDVERANEGNVEVRACQGVDARRGERGRRAFVECERQRAALRHRALEERIAARAPRVLVEADHLDRIEAARTVGVARERQAHRDPAVERLPCFALRKLALAAAQLEGPSVERDEIDDRRLVGDAPARVDEERRSRHGHCGMLT